MPRVSKIADIGIPVPTPAPDPTQILIMYYGPKGYTPSYSDTSRIEIGAVSTLGTKTVNGATCYDDPVATELPKDLAAGTYDFHFTLETADKLNEGDFSPAYTTTLDVVVPPTLGQPVAILG